MKTVFGGLKVIYLHPGEIYFSNSPEIIFTILGSCLTVTMFYKEKKLCGISHAVLPKCKTSFGNCRNCLEPYRYVDCSIKMMIEKFEAQKINRRDIEVKMFGAADMIDNLNQVPSRESVGKKNISTALEVLQNENLELSASDVGGKHGRKIVFLTIDGSVYLQRLNKNEKS